MGKYFIDSREQPEPQAANRWFAWAEEHGIDIPRAISIWEDAATETGNESRAKVREAGITIELAAPKTAVRQGTAETGPTDT